jgi:hypothetical protein
VRNTIVDSFKRPYVSDVPMHAELARLCYTISRIAIFALVVSMTLGSRRFVVVGVKAESWV